MPRNRHGNPVLRALSGKVDFRFAVESASPQCARARFRLRTNGTALEVAKMPCLFANMKSGRHGPAAGGEKKRPEQKLGREAR